MLDIQIASLDSEKIHREIIDQLRLANQKNRLRDRLANQYGFRLHNLSIPDTNDRSTSTEIMQAKSSEGSYSIDDFMLHYDIGFIVCCFRYLLKRNPEPSAVNYFLTSLRSGKLDRLEILGRIYLSREARAKKVKVRWLLPSFLLRSFYRIPVVGYIAHWFVILLSLPAVIKKQERERNHLVAEIKSVIEYSHKDSTQQIARVVNQNNEVLHEGIGNMLLSMDDRTGMESPTDNGSE